MPPRSRAALALLVCTFAAVPACESKALTAAEQTPGLQPPQTEETLPTSTPAAAGMEAAELADLERMCAAVDHDYIDGTLSDYFAETKSSTTWGRELQARADESITPGRELLGAAKARGWNAELGAPSCARLFDYLDDVE